MTIPAEKWKRSDAWEIREACRCWEGRAGVGVAGRRGCLGSSARSFAFGRACAARSSLLSNLLAGCAFRRKIDYGRGSSARRKKIDRRLLVSAKIGGRL